MEVRKRNVETLRYTSEKGYEVHGERLGGNSKRNSLVEEGLRLYQVAKQDEYKNNHTLEKCLKCFVQASENGDEEATLWISSFLSSLLTLPSSVIVPRDLIQKMQRITESTEEDNQIRIVARSMFSKMAGGNVSIPKEKIEESTSSILPTGYQAQAPTGVTRSIKRIMHDAMAAGGTRKVDETAFVETAVKYAKGQIGSSQASGALDLDPDLLEDFRSANVLKKVFSYPWQTLHYVKNSLWKTIEKRGVRWIWSSVPTKQFYLLLLAYFLPMLTVSFIVSSVFTVIFAIAFCSMILSTLQVMADSEKAFVLAEYSTVFHYFSDSKPLNPFHTQLQLIRHAIIPYITFLVSLAVAVLSIGLSLQQIMFYELLTVLAAGMSLIVFLQFEMYKSPVVMVTILTRTVSVIYVFLSIVSTVYTIPDYLLFWGKELVSFPWFPITHVHLSIINLVQFPVQLFTVAYLIYKNAWQNFFSGLGPCAIFLCWWLLCRDFLSYCSPYYLVKVGTTALVLLSLSPFFPLIFLLSPLLIGLYYGISEPFFISLSFVTIVSLVIVIFALNFKRLKEAKWLRIPLDYLFMLPFVLCIPVFLLGSSFYASIHNPPSLAIVSIKQYMEYCGPNNWINGNMVQTQLNCVHLQDRVIEGYGNVSSIKILRVINDRKASLSSLPAPIKTTLTCLFGQTEPMCGNRNMSTCVNAGCNFHNNLQYEFEIKMQMVDIDEANSSITISLLASNKYKEHGLNISVGMFLRFNASFVDGMGSDQLTLKTISLLLPNMKLDEDGDFDPDEVREYLLTNLFISVKNVLFFMIDVVFGYTLPEHSTLATYKL